MNICNVSFVRYSLALPLSLKEHVSASAAGAAFAAAAARDFMTREGLSVQLDALKSISSAVFGGESTSAKRVHVCYMCASPSPPPPSTALLLTLYLFISGDILTGHAVAQSVRRVIA